MKLTPGTKLHRYEIQSLVGHGGMGEVYLATDMELGRMVAIKVLNQGEDFEKLRRFRQEAKAVSALNHPNILTLYEFGQHEDLHFIVSEYIKGETLRERLSKNDLKLDEILDIAAQIGNALAAAHELGIVHRDIKPENIMILPDGYVKVLDFGLAKLTNLEKILQSTPDAPTASVIHTQSGLIMGTVNYMSPEQLRGQTVDERADIWSLGVVLFEMLTGGRQPFSGESVSDTIAAILSNPLPHLSKISPNIPAEIETVVARALEKQKEDRFTTAKDFVQALKNLKNYFLGRGGFSLRGATVESVPAQSTGQNQNRTLKFKNFSQLIAVKSRRSLMVVLLLAGFVFTGVALAIYVLQPSRNETGAAKKIKRLSTTGNRTNAALSPDGRFIAYVQTENGRHSLWRTQIDVPTGQQLIEPGSAPFGSITFSPDGDWIFFTRFEGSSSGTLYRIAFLGNAPQEIARDVDSGISFSPDGASFAFIRQKPDENVDRVVVADADGLNQRILIEKKRPEFLIKNNRESLSWSPDGKAIACPTGRNDAAGGDLMSLIEIDVKTARQKPVTQKKWSRIGRVLWTSDINTLLITAAEAGSNLYQIIKVTRGASAKTENITSEISDYFNISLSRDSKRLLATIYERSSNISIAPTAQINQLKPLVGGNYDGIGGVRYTSDGRVVFVSIESGNPDIWIADEDGGNRRQLTTDPAADESPFVSKDGKFIVFVSSRTGAPHVWRMNFDGGELKQLTDKGEEVFPQISPDGSFVVFAAKTVGPPSLWKAPADRGGEAVQFTNVQTRVPAISPDGRAVACVMRGTNPEDPFKLAVLSIENGEILKTFDFSGENSPLVPATLRWTSDAQSIAYIATQNGVSNILSQPIGGGAPKKLTDFSADRIFSFDFSADGKSVVFARGVMKNNLVLIEDF